MSIYDKIVPQILSSDLQELLDENAVENIRLEFKRELPAKDEMLKKLSSFANTYGGYVVIGADADSSSGRLLSFPGIDRVNGLKQRIVQWCFDSIVPPIQPFVSDPIEAPGNPVRHCHVIFIEESAEAPHFINSRKGAYVRTDEFSQRFEPQLMTFEEIQHLANRRQRAVERRNELFDRAEQRFQLYVAHDYSNITGSAGHIGAIMKLVICPRFPVTTLIEPNGLMDLLPKTQVRWRSRFFPYCPRPFVSQHESVIGLATGNRFSLLEANVWGQLYFATEVEEVAQEENVIHLHLLIGHLLVYLEHARVFYERIGFKGTLQFVLRLERVLRRPIRSARLGFGETPPASQFDDIVQFKVEFSSSTLAASRDDVAADLLQSILFGLNWPAAAADRGTVQKFIEDGYEYNGWDKPKSGS